MSGICGNWAPDIHNGSTLVRERLFESEKDIEEVNDLRNMEQK